MLKVNTKDYSIRSVTGQMVGPGHVYFEPETPKEEANQTDTDSIWKETELGSALDPAQMDPPSATPGADPTGGGNKPKKSKALTDDSEPETS